MLAPYGAAHRVAPRGSMLRPMLRPMHRRRAAIVRAGMSDRGKRLEQQTLGTVGSLLGEGSYGQVYRGVYSNSSAGRDESVILKRVRPRVEVREKENQTTGGA
jgi:serine/threonine protein kinase